jgi:hypothetical protein
MEFAQFHGFAARRADRWRGLPQRAGERIGENTIPVEQGVPA